MDFERADAINQAIRMLSLRHRARAAALLAPLGLHPGQEALLLELARAGPMTQARLSDALGCEPPSITLMTRKLEGAGHVRRGSDPSDKRASIVELTEGGVALAEQVKLLWCALAQETVTGLPDRTVAELPEVLRVLTGNVDTRRQTRHHHAVTVESEPFEHVEETVGSTDEYEPSRLDWVREHVEQIVRAGTTDGVTMNGFPMVLMTYRGARSGTVRKIPLMRVEYQGTYVIVASKGGAPTNPQWYASLLADPFIELQDGTVTRGYKAREVLGDEKAPWWDRAVEAYPDYAEYQRGTDRQIPVFVLEPVSGP